MNKQTKIRSAMETVCNTALGVVIGFTISQLAHHYEPWIQMYIWEDFTWNLSVSSNIAMTLILTLSSLLRGYFLRRLFNRIGGKK